MGFLRGELHKPDAFAGGAASHGRAEVHGEAFSRRAPHRQVGGAVADIGETLRVALTQELALACPSSSAHQNCQSPREKLAERESPEIRL